MMKSMRKKKLTFVISLILLLTVGQVSAQEQNNFELSKNMEIYADIMRQLNLNYADDIKPGELNTIAIDAMLSHLDPYTVYIPESRREDFELLTKGEYGGIGALIQQQGDRVIISEPYEGFPAQKAGLKAGDVIHAIDGVSAIGKSSSDVSAKLKGTPGTTLVLSISRFGDTIIQDIEIEREKVKFPNIPFYGMINENIGYINLMQFNPKTAQEVKNAFVDLKDNNELKGIIIDLRGNGGGLLTEAVDLVNIFVPKNRMIVTTKGKLAANTHIHSTRNSAFDTKIPLAILVNGSSASASEIVAGSIQDLDRGVIIGNKTFGKGLVQNILDAPYNSKVKITIAKYYIPSGRCIQAIDYFDEDSTLNAADSSLHKFKTKGGRIVYDKGGIEPDVTVEGRYFSQISGDLYAQNYIFNFANDFATKHDSIASPKDFVITDSIFDCFKHYVEKQEFDYKTETEMLLEKLESSADREDYKDAIENTIAVLEDQIAQEKKKDIDKNKEEIEEMLKIEIVSRYYYQRGKLESSLLTDHEVEKAVEILSNKELYDSIINGEKSDNK